MKDIPGLLNAYSSTVSGRALNHTYYQYLASKKSRVIKKYHTLYMIFVSFSRSYNFNKVQIVLEKILLLELCAYMYMCVSSFSFQSLKSTVFNHVSMVSVMFQIH